jgi:hypothetical protein
MTFDPLYALVIYHHAIEIRDLVALRRSFAPDARYVSMGLGAVEGREAVLASIESYFAKFPDHEARDEKVWRVSDHVAACEWRLKGTLADTGDVIERRGVETITFNERGLILSVEIEDR